MKTHHEERMLAFGAPPLAANFRKRLVGWLTGGKSIAPAVSTARIPRVNLRHLKTKLSRLNLTDAAREAAALKAQFRREDEELCRRGRGAEVVADRMKSLGITDSGETRLITVNGVGIKS